MLAPCIHLGCLGCLGYLGYLGYLGKPGGRGLQPGANVPSILSACWLACQQPWNVSINLAPQGEEEAALIHEMHLRYVEAIVGVEVAVVTGGPARCTPGWR